MIHRTRTGVMLTAFVILGLTGCMPKMDIEAMKEARPKRPAELDKLNTFTGTWKSTSEMTMRGVDEVLKGTGTGTAAWEGDGWYLVERGKYDMGELGKMEGLGVWTWDPKSKKYRTAWFDTLGYIATGTDKYCEKSNSWRMKSKNRTPWGTTYGKGTATIVDDDTVEWSFEERSFLGLIKTMEMKGTSKRQ